MNPLICSDMGSVMIFKTCLWAGTEEAADFHGMNINLYDCMWRTCEIGILRKSCILNDNRTSGPVTESVPNKNGKVKYRL